MKAQQSAYLVEPGTVVWDQLDGRGPIVQLEAYSDPNGLDVDMHGNGIAWRNRPARPVAASSLEMSAEGDSPRQAGLTALEQRHQFLGARPVGSPPWGEP